MPPMPSDVELTINSAARAYDIRRRTLRALLDEGAIDGARRRDGPTGPEWVFPATSLEALGYRRSPRPADDPRDRPRSRAWWVGLGVLAFLVLVPIIAVASVDDAGDEASDADPRERLTAFVAAQTVRGEPVGAVGASALELVPAERAPVVITGDGVPEPRPRYVIVSDDGPRAGRQWVSDHAAATEMAVEHGGQAYRLVDLTGPGTSAAAPTTSSTVADETAASTTPVADEHADSGAPPATTTPPPPPAPPGPEDEAPGPDGAGQADLDDAQEDGTTEPLDAAPSGSPPASVEVRPGEHFWAIAADVVRDGDPEAGDAEIAEYWLDLIELNEDRLVEPGNPDLLVPGQVLLLPPVPG